MQGIHGIQHSKMHATSDRSHSPSWLVYYHWGAERRGVMGVAVMVARCSRDSDEQNTAAIVGHVLHMLCAYNKHSQAHTTTSPLYISSILQALFASWSLFISFC